MDQSLKDAAQHGDIDGLYSSIQRDECVLKKIDEKPFVETPLHIALAAGEAEFAMEIMKLQPSFAKKLNQNGDSPMHLALKNKQTSVVLQLLNVNEDLVRIQGKHGLTPLHFVAQTGHLELLVEFLKACPRSIEDVTNRHENVLHVALKNEQLDAFKLLLGWLQRSWFTNASLWEEKLLNWQDLEGNTVLHIAVSKNLPEIVRRLFYFNRPFRIININTKNSEDHTAIELAQRNTGEGRKILEILQVKHKLSSCFLSEDIPAIDFFKSPKKFHEALSVFFLRQRTNLSNDTRNMLLVVLHSYNTHLPSNSQPSRRTIWQDTNLQGKKMPHGINPVGFSRESISPPPQPPHLVGTATMGSTMFITLSVLNSISFLLTIFATIILLPMRRGIFTFPLYVLCTSFAAAIDITAPITIPGGGSIPITDYISLVAFPLLLLAFEGSWNLGLRRLVYFSRSNAKVLDPNIFNVY